MPSKEEILSAEGQPQPDDHEEVHGLVKEIAIESYRQAELDFLKRLRQSGVAVYTGNPDRYMNAHLADFMGTLEVNALVFVELHRTCDVVGRTIDNLPQFDQLPVKITQTTQRPFLGFGRDALPLFELCFDDAQPRSILRPVQKIKTWSLMASVNYRQAEVNKQINVLVVGSSCAVHVLAFLTKYKIEVTALIAPEDDLLQ